MKLLYIIILITVIYYLYNINIENFTNEALDNIANVAGMYATGNIIATNMNVTNDLNVNNNITTKKINVNDNIVSNNINATNINATNINASKMITAENVNAINLNIKPTCRIITPPFVNMGDQNKIVYLNRILSKGGEKCQNNEYLNNLYYEDNGNSARFVTTCCKFNSTN